MIFAASQRANPRVGDAVQVGNEGRLATAAARLKASPSRMIISYL
jgi:hypothetical protein